MKRDGKGALNDSKLEQEIYETLLWRGDTIPTTERGVEIAEEGERFRECNEGRARTIANRERYEDRERCKAARSDGECWWPECPQLRDGEPEKTGRHCPIDTWVDDDE